MTVEPHSPAARFVIPFVAGVAGGLAVGRFPYAVALGVTALFVLLLLGFVVPKRTWQRVPRLTVVVFLLMAAVSGFVRVVVLSPVEEPCWPRQESVWQGVVMSRTETPRSRRLLLRLPPRTNVLVTLRPDSAAAALRPGDAIRFSARVLPPENNDSLSRSGYAAYVRRHGILGTAFVWHRWHRLPTPLADSLAAVLPWTARLQLKAARWRHRLALRYAPVVSDPRDLAVLSAMTLGEKSRLTRDMRTSYSDAGVAHLLALSGLHLGILVTLLLLLLRPLSASRGGRVAARLLTLLFIWLFALLTGFSLPTVRAAAMYSLFCLFFLQGRDGNALNSLFVTAFLVLLVSPFQLLDVGFQLSFLSVLSILLFLPLRRCYAGLCWPLVMLLDVVGVSCAAQLGTFPVVAYHFSTFPVYFLVANVVAVPCAYVLLGGALLFFACAPFPAVQALVGRGLSVVTHGMNGWLDWVSGLPHAVLPWCPTLWQTGVCYAVMLGVVWHCRGRSWRTVAVVIVLSGVLAVSVVLGW